MIRSAPRTTATLLLVPLLALAGSCDNVGRAFDPKVGPPPGTASTVQVVPVRGDAREGRPMVRATLPTGGGWPITVPIVVEFSESVNESTLRPSSSTSLDARLIVRIQGTEQALPASYDFILGGRVAILRPTPALTNVNNPTYEVVLRPEGRDVDGVRFSGSTDRVLATFTVDEAQGTADGHIVTVLPRDNNRDVPRESDVYVIFDKPPIPTSVTSTSLQVRPAGGAALTGTLVSPLRIAGVEDPRVVRFRVQGGLPGPVQVEVVVTDQITFPSSGVLQFGNRTPFSVFDTLAFSAPTSVTVGNPSAGFPDKINRQNAQNLVLHVDTPASALTGDRVLARIYGLDPSSQTPDDVIFVERSAPLAADGVQTAVVDFSGALGTLTNPEFGDGAVTLAVQLQRGSLHSGYVHGAGSNPRFDVTPPTLDTAGPPNLAGTQDLLTDQESLSFYGTANEAVAEAALTVGAGTAQLFAAASDGRFVLQPLALGRLTAPANYSLQLTDSAGNLTAAPIAARILQRGLVTGTVAGTLTVEVFDDATLQAIPGATVVVDPGAPTVPPAAGRVTAVTDAAGRAVFNGLAAASHTVTAAIGGYHLTTLYDSPVAFASLPLRPVAGATATFAGAAAFTPVPNATAMVGNHTIDDPAILAVRTQTSSPNTIPQTAIRPFRAQVVSAFSGQFEPTGVPTFTGAGCSMCGNDLVTPTPPGAPVAPGDTGNANVVLLPAIIGTVGSLAPPYAKDFAQAIGLDTGNLAGPPIVRVTASLPGFGGQALIGVGFTTAQGGASFLVNGSWSLPMLATLTPYAPVTWVATEAQDGAGNVSRHRALLNPLAGTVLDLLQPPSIPLITPPGGPVTGPPAVTFVDRLAPGAVAGGLGMVDLVATDGAGRQWRVLQEDADVAGGNRTVQFPDLAGTGAAGLANGIWQVRAEARLYVSSTSAAGDVVLEERRRQEATWARSQTVQFSVQ